ncbi:GDP-mannose 4,6-dehydratase [Rhodopirellula sallentina]|uniref:GDP-mannose 4,6-dehydratase n=1 Tax=Rhodopirellula sallentina SM41 TaxID=1263870 RepID=M5U9U0_9BACT|nr:GDP-mannose 4,6-dehydratase [Rhodopirellula sallentina]EMI58084.1 GDP-mannose 4,6 dehydratase [Rhodopirellula sallentina SM41]
MSQPSPDSSATKTALITGITGQDGSYLTELLLSKGYIVHGLVRRTSNTVRSRLDSLFHDKNIYERSLFLHYGDLDDATTIRRILLKTQPDEIYHLAGQSHVGLSFEIPESTCQFTAMGTLKLLEMIRDLEKQPRLLHISSSEIFGRPDASPQNEQTPMRPVTPYGVAKTFATQMVQVYRRSFDCFACNAICYNHESPRRGESFVTRKITRAAAAISLGLQSELRLGALDARRDWGDAQTYVTAMWMMLQQDAPDDYVLATGRTHSIQDFLEFSFDHVDLDWRDYVVTDPKFIRPTDVADLCGDPSHATEKLGWQPPTSCQDLAQRMVDHDLQLLQRKPIPAKSSEAVSR